MPIENKERNKEYFINFSYTKFGNFMQQAKFKKDSPLKKQNELPTNNNEQQNKQAIGESVKTNSNAMFSEYAKIAKENANKIKLLKNKLKNIELSDNPTKMILIII